MKTLQIEVSSKNQGIMQSATSVGRPRARYSEVKITGKQFAEFKLEMEKILKKLVPSAVKQGVTKKWATDYVLDWYKEQVDNLEEGMQTYQEALKSLRGLTIKDCVSDFKSSMERAEKVKNEVKTKQDVRTKVMKALKLNATEFKALCKLMQEEK